jgi:quercetin dioxygenase-like cupin family protein
VLVEQVSVESDSTYIVALGRDDLDLRLQRATSTYTSRRQPPLPTARPFILGNATLTPLFDKVLGNNHLSKGRYEPGTTSVLHTHDSDQYIIVTGGEGTVSTPTETHRLRPGMVVWIPKGEAHIHAAGHLNPLEFIFLAATGCSSDVVEP